MKLISSVSTLCLVVGWHHAEANVDLATILESGPACGSSGGCTVATGKQVVLEDADGNFLGSRSAFGQFVYEFDSGFTQMTYATRVYDGENALTTFDVDDARLVCLFAGDVEPAATEVPLLRVQAIEDITLARLMVNSQGSLQEGLFLNSANLNPTPVICDPFEDAPLTINNMAALYEAMLRGYVAVLFEVKDVFTETTSLIRSQIFVAKEFY
jgi:hypothetical protein